MMPEIANKIVTAWTGYSLILVLGLAACSDSATPTPASRDFREILRGPQPTAELQDTRSPFIAVLPGGLPESPPIAQLIKRSVYACDGVVPAWLQSHLRLELGTLAQLEQFETRRLADCTIEFEVQDGRAMGNPMVHFFESREDAMACLSKFQCQGARNAALIARKDGLYRSYFLLDQTGGRYAQHCITPRMQWEPNSTCYTVEPSGR